MIDFIRVLRLRMARRLQIVGVVRTAVCVVSRQDVHGKGIGSSFQIALALLGWAWAAARAFCVHGRMPHWIARWVRRG